MKKEIFGLYFIPVTSFQSENSHVFATVKLGLWGWLYMDNRHRMDWGP